MEAVDLSIERHQDVMVNVEARKEFGDHVNRAVLLSSEFGAFQNWVVKRLIWKK